MKKVWIIKDTKGTVIDITDSEKRANAFLKSNSLLRAEENQIDSTEAIFVSPETRFYEVTFNSGDYGYISENNKETFLEKNVRVSARQIPFFKKESLYCSNYGYITVHVIAPSAKKALELAFEQLEGYFSEHPTYTTVGALKKVAIVE